MQFYAPNQETHHFFNTPWEEVIKHCSNNFTTWIVGTYARIKQAGIPCEIVSHLPAQGIVIADRDSLGNHYPYLPNTLIVCACADREFHPSAYFHIVQNPVALTKKKNALWRPHYIPHWIQPNLIPRSAERGDRVENVAFIGTRSNLAKEFSSETWLQGLKDIGCNWLPIFEPERWSDYSNIDVVVAVRDFSGSPHDHKPASKLVNCWSASVPAILGPESAFVSLKKSELDFIAAHSIEQTLSEIKQLKNDPLLYSAMVNNGTTRIAEFTQAQITKRYTDFFGNYVFPEYDQWLARSDNSLNIDRAISFSKRYARLKSDRLKARLARTLKE
ncbi:MAG: glycosyltransferase family 1 protein [Phormidesmis sp. RL_2_1]|nr:glycosyltransferase family 1 protein [Phormidesmis sp. RL_2_1]